MARQRRGITKQIRVPVLPEGPGVEKIEGLISAPGMSAGEAAMSGYVSRLCSGVRKWIREGVRSGKLPRAGEIDDEVDGMGISVSWDFGTKRRPKEVLRVNLTAF